MIFRRVLLVTVAVSCLAVAGCQDDKKDDGDKDPVGPATLATPTALFKCDEVSQAEFQSRNEVLFKFGFVTMWVSATTYRDISWHRYSRCKDNSQAALWPTPFGQLLVGDSVIRTKSLNVYKSCLEMVLLEK